MRVKKLLLSLFLVFLGAKAFAFDNANIILAKLDIPKNQYAWLNMGPTAPTASCYSCTSTKLFAWEANSLTVGDTGFSPCGCSQGDTTVDNTVGSDEALSGGSAVFNDLSADGNDHYRLVVSNDDIINDALFTVFIPFKIATGGWVNGIELLNVRGDSSNKFNVYLSSDNDLSCTYTFGGSTSTRTTPDSQLAVNTEYIARIRVNTSATDPSPDFSVCVFTTSMVEVDCSEGYSGIDALSVTPIQMDIGNNTSTPGGNFSIHYVHIVHDWVDADPFL